MKSFISKVDNHKDYPSLTIALQTMGQDEDRFWKDLNRWQKRCSWDEKFLFHDHGDVDLRESENEIKVSLFIPSLDPGTIITAYLM